MITSLADISAAADRLRPLLPRTPTVHSPGLSELLGREIWIKADLLLPTGSFKIRGVTNKVLSLDETAMARGVIAMSAGNHAIAVAHAAARAGVAATVCMPAAAVQFKVDAVRRLGARVELVDGDLVDHTMRRRDELDATLIHPFDDPVVVAGAATCGLEAIEDLPSMACAIVPVGGGGLISGVAAAIKLHAPHVRVVGVEPETADVVRRSLAAGAPVKHPSPRSLADGLGAPISGQINLDHIAAFVDEMVVIEESSIRPAWHDLLNHGKLAGEPSSAVGIAALRAQAIGHLPDGPICLFCCGGNSDLSRLFEA